MTTVIVIFALAGVLAAFLFSILMNRLRRRSATYKLYEARDNFIMLVASEIISEESLVFKYYYKRINMLLQFAPNIGLDDALKSFLLQKSKTPDNLKNAIEKARIEAEKVLSSKELEIPEVREAVTMYYSSNREMVMAHSSLIRLICYSLGVGSLSDWIISKVPRNVQKGLAIVQLADEELDSLAHKSSNYNFAH